MAGLDGDKLQRANSNTTLVKVKSYRYTHFSISSVYSNTTLVKVKFIITVFLVYVNIYSNTTLVKVKLLVRGCSSVGLEQFKYNTC